MDEIKVEDPALDLKADPVRKKGAVVYTGDFSLVDKLAVRIPKVGNEYEPTNKGQVEELEYQVTQGRVTKEVF